MTRWRQWYRRAAEQEDASAQFNLGVMWRQFGGCAAQDDKMAAVNGVRLSRRMLRPNSIWE
ncbi:MAG: hypothetical protein ACYYK0_01695 [Candidatus Eutrophobiaceae bacterium]